LARWWRRGRPVPGLEAAVLALSLVAIATPRFSGILDSIPSLSAVSSQMPLTVQLPFLLWAAMRFGPTGTGIAVLFTSLTSAWSVVNGVGPFAEIPASTTVRALTMAMIVVATTLLYLATLIEDRRQTQHALKLRLEFESLLSRLSSALVQQPSDQMTRAFETWVARLARVLGIDGLTVFVTSAETSSLTAMYSWVDRSACSDVADIETQHLAWAE